MYLGTKGTKEVRKGGKYRDGTRLFSGIPESRKSPGILEKGKKFWNLEKLKESYNSNF